MVPGAEVQHLSSVTDVGLGTLSWTVVVPNA